MTTGDTAAGPWSELPAELGDLMRPGLAQLADEMIVTLSREVPEYARPLEGDFGRVIREGVTVALTQFVALLGRPDDVPDLTIYEALGRAQLREGRTLDALQSAYRVGARVAWRYAVTAGERAGVRPEVLYRLAEAIFAYIDRLAAASVAGYALEQSLRAGTAQAHRHALVELLSRWPVAAPGDVERAAAQAGWPLPEQVAAVAVGGGDAAALARRLPSGTIGAALDPVGVLLVPDPDAPARPAQVAAGLGRTRAVLGPTVSWTETHRSIARAVSAWPLHAAGALGEQPLVRADDHLLALVLAADPALTRDLVRLRLAPLDALPPTVRERAESTLRAWCSTHGDVTAAAAQLGVHPQTVRYRLAGLREAFGDALDSPRARLEIELALQAADVQAGTV